MNKTLYKTVISSLLILVSLVLFAEEPVKGKPHYLLLHSWHYGNHWSMDILSGLEEGISANDVVLHNEYMNMDLNQSPVYSKYLIEHINENYKDIDINRIIALGIPAEKLAGQLKKDLFKNAELQYVGLPAVPGSKNRGIVNAVRNTVDLIRQIKPKLNYLVLVYGNSPDSQATGKVAEETLKKYRFSFPLIILSGSKLSSTAMLEKIKSLPSGGAILFSQWLYGAKNKFIPQERLFRTLCDVTPSPVFSISNYAMGSGVVGGKMFHGADIGANLAESMRSNTNFRLPRSRWMFDENAFRKWGISLDFIPEHATVVHHQPTFAEKNYKYIMAATIGLISIFVAILLVLVNYTRRRRVEEVFETIFEETPNAIVVFDTTGAPKFANKSMLNLLGLRKFEQMSELNLFVHLLNSEQTEALDHTKEAIKLEISLDLSHAKKLWLPVAGASGTLTLEVSVRKLVLHNRTTFVTIINDVSHTRKLMQHMELLEAAVSRSAVAVLLVKPDHSIYYINYAASEWFSIERDSCEKHLVEELLSGNQKDLKSLQRIFTERYSSFTAEFKTGVGSLFTAAVHGSIISSGGQKMTCLFVEDISMRLRAQDELRESEERLSLAVKGADLGLFDWDIREQRIQFSAASAAFFSNKGDSVSVPIDEWEARIVEEDRMVALQKISDCLTGSSKEYISRYRLKAEDGSIRNVVDTGTVIEFDSHGKPLRVVGTQRDETEEKMWELKLLEAKRHAEESDRLKTFFLSNISHEIRTPLNGVLGFARLLMDAEPGSESCKKYMDMISSSADMLLKLISDILDFSRLESGELQLTKSRVNANAVLRDMLDEFYKVLEEDKGDKVELYCLPGLADQSAEITTDPKRLRQVMRCLLTNAVKFTEEGQIEFGYNADSHAFLEFFVKDTGIGIPPDQRELIFEYFRQGDGSDTRRHGGTGLGLALARKLVEMLGGVIWVESSNKGGTMLKFTIPRS